ncbi:hypothetical protein QFZ53_002288 [Microbacterium natoriense]|uniref:Lipoprotein n=1 Tax=Microbacterium natoriense TaxID=284570 RepID=A0AAW8F0J4_9MICO|nr:hypothetical protein [Microbacterium natoriense]MDQ0648092.1 hypothetical protein [Microbacterium natoriense]
MNRRRQARWTTPVLVLAALLPASGCAVNACPAVGYSYDGPAVIRFAPVLPPAATVASCFGEECTPAAAVAASGDWKVPQEAPYIPAGSIAAGEIRSLRVVAATSSEVLVDGTYEIPIEMEPEGVFGQCPGPFRFEPVAVEWEP